MAKTLLLDKAGPPCVRISCADGEVTVRMPPDATGRRLFALVLLVLVSLALLGTLTVIGVMAWVAIAQASLALGVFTLLLAAGWIPAIAVWLWLQRQLLSFRAAVGRGRYRLAYGLIRLSLALETEDAIVVIDPSHHRGDFGYGAHLKRRKEGILRLPFLPRGVFGSKSEAQREAERIGAWLRENTSIGEVALSKYWEKVRDLEERG